MKSGPRLSLRSAAVRLWRVAALVLLAWLVRTQTLWLQSRAEVPDITLEEAQLFFPDAAALSPGSNGTVLVYDAAGNAAGSVLSTSPHTDHIRGYSGPNDILTGLDTAGKVTGIHLRRSGDTPEHAAMVEQDAAFAAQFKSWRAGQPPEKVETVAGATLTSAAVAEAVQARIAGGAPSLRFPESVTLEEVQAMLPAAAALTPEAGRLRVDDAGGALLGYAVRTSPAADNVPGFRGPTEALALLTPGGKVAEVRLRKSFDTPGYVQQIRSDEWFLAGFKGRTAAEIAAMDFAKEGIEGVSGATETSWAIAEGLKRRFAASPAAQPPRKFPAARDYLTVAVVAGGLLMAFSRLRGKRWLRFTWQGLLMVWALWTGGDLLSLALLGGWAQHGVAWQAAPGAALLAAAALFIPWSTRRQVYCHQLCPHGAAQEWLGRLRPRKLAVPPKLDRLLRTLPWLLLAVAAVMLLLGAGDVNLLEPFDAWLWRAAALVPLLIAAAGLLAAVFIPQAYCRYGCPTGAVLGFVRSRGSQDAPGRRDAAMLGLLLVSAAAVLFSRTSAAPLVVPAVSVLRGEAMGSTWEIRLRGFSGDTAALEREAAALLEELEAQLSVWRGDSAVSLFNAVRSTAPVPVPSALSQLVTAAAEVSAATEGAFDVTAGPLVRLWGFGPPPRPEVAPDDPAIAAALARTGWRNVSTTGDTMAKADALIEVDVTALTEGYAADRMAARLKEKGVSEFLINISGELRARGRWTIAIEHPARTLTLRDSALATSGTYRQQREMNGQRRSHLIDARSGKPVEHRTVSVSVRHPEAVTADVWATALNILGSSAGLPLAEKLGIAAEFTDEDENGRLSLQATAAWRSR